MSHNNPSHIPLYRELASRMDAYSTCIAKGNTDGAVKHMGEIRRLVAEYMPSGSGIDAGVGINVDATRKDKLVFDTSFHHMNEGGFYDGWTEHQVIVTPSLQFGIDLRITGRNRNDIKDYLHGVFDDALRSQEWR